MGLARVQAALAKLVTHAEARAAFARDPMAAARALGLEQADAAMLALLAPTALNRFAGSLKAKRRLDVQKWLPLTARALGDRFAPLLREVLAEPPPGTAADALALVARLAREPGWIGDLARYEGAFVEAWRPGFVLRVRLFRHPPPAVAAAARRGETPEPPAARACLGIRFRASRGGRLRHRIWRLPRAFGN